MFTTVLEKEVKEKNFINIPDPLNPGGDNIQIPSGPYMKLNPNNFSVTTETDAGGNFVTFPTQTWTAKKRSHFPVASFPVTIKNPAGGNDLDYTVPAGSMISNCKYLGFNCISNDKYFHSLEEIALSFLNSPYLWGGKTKFGTDCSGFVQSAFKIYGKILPRDSYQQALIGTEVNLENSKTGDLAFFGKKIDTITHVGIVISNNRIIHSAGKVRIDNIINEGIFNVDSRKISHKLQLVRRIVN